MKVSNLSFSYLRYLPRWISPHQAYQPFLNEYSSFVLWILSYLRRQSIPHRARTANDHTESPWNIHARNYSKYAHYGLFVVGGTVSRPDKNCFAFRYSSSVSGDMMIKYNNSLLRISGTHYNAVIMSAMASQITSLTIVYSTVYSDTDKKNIKAPRHWLLWGEFTGHRWIPRTKGQ